MNATAQPLAAAEPVEPGADLAAIPRETALSVLTNSAEFDAFYSRVKAEVDAHVPDVTTPKGREAIKSLAFKVTKTKTAIDAAGKALTEEWRSQTAKVDAARKAIRDKLDALRDDVRQPVAEWEAAEEKRIATATATLDRLKIAGVVAMGETASEVSGRLAEVEATALDPKLFGDLLPIAEAAVEHAKMILQAAVARLTQEEADRAELDRLRQEAREREEREAREAAERQRAADEAAAAEARARAEAKAKEDAEAAAALAAKEQAEREHQAAARAAQEAEERARAEERQQAEEAAAAERRASEARLAEERRQREEAEAEATRLRQDEEARQRAEREQEAAAQRRAADIEHRGAIMGAAKAALMAIGGIKEEAAKKIVLAIKADEIPNVSIRF